MLDLIEVVSLYYTLLQLSKANDYLYHLKKNKLT